MEPAKILEGVIVAQKIFEVGEKILSGGYGFAIPASIEVIETGYGDCPLD
jgi:hypothetical protein